MFESCSRMFVGNMSDLPGQHYARNVTLNTVFTGTTRGMACPCVHAPVLTLVYVRALTVIRRISPMVPVSAEAARCTGNHSLDYPGSVLLRHRLSHTSSSGRRVRFSL